MFDVCVVGHVTKDRIQIPGRPDREMAGGTAYYVSRAWAALGLSVCVVTKMRAEDEAELSNDLSQRGIVVLNRGSAATTVFENRYDGPGLSERTQVVRAVADPFEVRDLDGVQARALHVGPLTRDEVPVELYARLRSTATLIALDGQGLLREIVGGGVQLAPFSGLDQVLPHVDVLKVDDREAEIMVGEPDPARAAAALEQLGVREVLTTFADRGSAVRVQGRLTRVPPVPPVETIDATGCGDTFLAGYIFARLEGHAPALAAGFASAAASLKLADYGAFAGSAAEVWAHMRRRPR